MYERPLPHLTSNSPLRVCAVARCEGREANDLLPQLLHKLLSGPVTRANVFAQKEEELTSKPRIQWIEIGQSRQQAGRKQARPWRRVIASVVGTAFPCMSFWATQSQDAFQNETPCWEQAVSESSWTATTEHSCVDNAEAAVRSLIVGSPTCASGMKKEPQSKSPCLPPCKSTNELKDTEIAEFPQTVPSREPGNLYNCSALSFRGLVLSQDSRERLSSACLASSSSGG